MGDRVVALQVNRGTQEALNALTLFDGEPYGLLTTDEQNEATIKLYIGVGGEAVPVSACAGLTPIAISGTETLAAGEPASVVNEGTSTNVLLKFSIPKGDKGDPGPAGERGETGVGQKGDQGTAGATGENAYQVWLSAGNVGTVSQYLASLKGETGSTGPAGAKGDKGDTGSAAFTMSIHGVTGLSYGSTPTVTNVGTAIDQQLDFGIPAGAPGSSGAQGSPGESAYQVWLSSGNTGTVADYLLSLKGADGKSAYTAALENGYVGTESTFNGALVAVPVHVVDETKHVGTATKTTPVDADSIALIDSADGSKVKKLTWASFKSALNNLYAIKSHASSATTYGVGTATNNGHLKLSDATNGTSGVAGSTAATPLAVKTAYDKAVTVETALTTKADKTQPTWLSPTLVNGATGTLQYRKNVFGRLEFKGYINVATANTLQFTLPDGYRPPVETVVGVANEDGSLSGFNFATNGQVSVYGNTKQHDLYHLTFAFE